MLMLHEDEIRQLELCHVVVSRIVLRSSLDGGTEIHWLLRHDTETHCLPRHETPFVIPLTVIERQGHE
jgi:hypothetical protein